MTIEINPFSYGSEDYGESVKIRDLVFRKPWGLSIYDDDLSDDQEMQLFGAYDNGRLIGTAFLQEQDAKTGIVRSVIVLPEYRGTGLGKKLMDVIESEAKKKGFEVLKLKGRETVRAFYEHLGYHATSEVFLYRKVPHLMMEKALGEPIILANPAGNLTAFIKTPTDPPTYASTAAKLMKEYPEIEQVGYITKPQMGGVSRLEMMGGEFCGNATRAFGLYTAIEQSLESPISIEVSGLNEPISVVFDKGEQTSSIALKKPNRFVEVKTPFGIFPVVVMEGIVHAIVRERCLSPDEIRAVIDCLKTEFPADAYGVMLCEQASYDMTPYVYVTGTDTLIAESSCGSGSIAYATFKNRHASHFRESIRQPGGIIEVTASESEPDLVYMGGPVDFDRLDKASDR